MKEDLENLALSMNTYAMYLDEKNTDQQKRQQLSHPVRQIAEYTWLETRESSEVIENQYSILDNSITKLSNYTYICFDEQSHVVAPFKHSMEKTRFINNLRLSLPVNILTYNPGGSVGLIFLYGVFQKTDYHKRLQTLLLKYLRNLDIFYLSITPVR